MHLSSWTEDYCNNSVSDTSTSAPVEIHTSSQYAQKCYYIYYIFSFGQQLGETLSLKLKSRAQTIHWLVD